MVRTLELLQTQNNFKCGVNTEAGHRFLHTVYPLNDFTIGHMINNDDRCPVQALEHWILQFP